MNLISYSPPRDHFMNLHIRVIHLFFLENHKKWEVFESLY